METYQVKSFVLEEVRRLEKLSRDELISEIVLAKLAENCRKLELSPNRIVGAAVEAVRELEVREKQRAERGW